jgi:hypothetical protein
MPDICIECYSETIADTWMGRKYELCPKCLMKRHIETEKLKNIELSSQYKQITVGMPQNFQISSYGMKPTKTKGEKQYRYLKVANSRYRRKIRNFGMKPIT